MKKILVVFLAFLMLFGFISTSLASNASTFTDVHRLSYAFEDIESLADQKIVQGTGDNKFEPDRSITQAELIEILHRAFSQYLLKVYNSSDDINAFPTNLAISEQDIQTAMTINTLNISNDVWYTKSANWASQHSLIPDNKFYPNSSMTRINAIAMFSKIIEILEFDLLKTNEKAPFTDLNDLTAEELTAITLLYQAGALNGMPDGTLQALSYMSRAQAAKIVNAILNDIDKPLKEIIGPSEPTTESLPSWSDPTPAPPPTPPAPDPTPNPNSVNYIPNNSFEEGTAYWENGSWGADNNYRLDHIDNDSHDGAHCIMVTIEDYTNTGDAKYMSYEIPVVAGKYNFAVWYKSNIQSEAGARLTMVDGSQTFIYISELFATPDIWQQYEGILDLPENVKSISLYVAIFQTGWLKTDDYMLCSLTLEKSDYPLTTTTVDNDYLE